MLLRVGQSFLRGDLSRYARHFNLLEVLAEPGTLPRSGRLQEWRRLVGGDFVFSVRLPAVVGALEEGPALEAALDYGNRVAEALQASWLVLQTPPSVTPSERSERRLSALLLRLRRDGVRVAWEPHGLWQTPADERTADRLGVHLVRDARRTELPANPIVYTRLRALGAGVRFGANAADSVAEHLFGRDESFVVIEGSGAVEGAAALRRLVEEEQSADEP